eukprot:9380668-Lingulodinium_polyedra.AAC.1
MAARGDGSGVFDRGAEATRAETMRGSRRAPEGALARRPGAAHPAVARATLRCSHPGATYSNLASTAR